MTTSRLLGLGVAPSSPCRFHERYYLYIIVFVIRRIILPLILVTTVFGFTFVIWKAATNNDEPSIPQEQRSNKVISTNWIKNASSSLPNVVAYADTSSKDTTRVIASQAPFLYQSVPDSGNYDKSVNMTPQEKKDKNFNGWIITEADFHFKLGKRSEKKEDGWVGYGSTHGKNWVWHRLSGTGTLDNEGNFKLFGNKPSFDRSKLNIATHSIALPDRSTVVGSTLTWNDIWDKKGKISYRIKTSGNGIKDEIVVPNPSRQYLIEQVQDKEFIGYIFEIDWGDVAKITQDDKVIDMTKDFNDNNKMLQFFDKDGKHMGNLASDIAYIEGIEQSTENTIPLTKFFFNKDGRTQMLLAIKKNDLEKAPNGTLIFDPTLNLQVPSNSNNRQQDSGTTTSSSGWTTIGTGTASDNPDQHNFARFTGATVTQGATINSATLSLRKLNTQWQLLQFTIYGYNVDQADAQTGRLDTLAKTTANVVENTNSNHTADTWYDWDVTDIIQEIVDRPGYTSTSIGIIFAGTGASSFARMTFYDYADDAASAPTLDITYSPPPVLNFEGVNMSGIDIN